MAKKYFLPIFLLIAIIPMDYWEGYLGIWAMPFDLLLAVLVLVLLINFLVTFSRYFFNRAKEKKLFHLGFMLLALSLIALKVCGFINLDKLNGPVLLFAQREGAANCMTTLKLRANCKFTERSVCFGVDKTWGEFTKSRDTILFSSLRGYQTDNFYEFAIIKESKFSWNEGGQEIWLYQNKRDTTGTYLTVIQNNF